MLAHGHGTECNRSRIVLSEQSETNNLNQRLKDHRSKTSRAAKFSKENGEFKLVYSEEYSTFLNGNVSVARLYAGIKLLVRISVIQSFRIDMEDIFQRSLVKELGKLDNKVKIST